MLQRFSRAGARCSRGRTARTVRVTSSQSLALPRRILSLPSHCAIHSAPLRASTPSPAPARPVPAAPSDHASTQTFTVQQLVDALSSGQIKPSLPATPEAAPSNAAPPTVRLRGWVRSIRTSKVTSFLTLNDGTSLLSVQCVLDVPVAERCLPAGVGLSNGCSIEVEGQLLYSYKVAQGIAKAQVAGSTDAATLNPLHNLSALISTSSTTPLPQLPVVEILVSSIHLHGACDGATYPIAKQTLPFDHLREFMHLRTRTATLAAVMRIRSRAQMGVHEFFQSEGFFNVHTPILTPLDSVTSSMDKPDQPFFGRPTFLTVSGQLYAEMLACSLSRVYTFGPTFRAEQSQTVRHLNEFWMIEPEVTHMDLKQVMDLAERFVKSTVRYILQHCETDLRFLQSRLSNPTLLSTLQATSAEDFTFARVTFSEALEILHKSKKKFQFLPSWENGLQSEHEKYLSDVHFRRPVFISHYPRASKPFYMRTTPPAAKEGVDATKETASCFDLIIPGVGELIGGSEREERYDELVKNMQQHKIDPKLYQWYLDLRTYGTVPHAGFGLGFERLLRYVTGMQNIRELILVPRTPGAAGGAF